MKAHQETTNGFGHHAAMQGKAGVCHLAIYNSSGFQILVFVPCCATSPRPPRGMRPGGPAARRARLHRPQAGTNSGWKPGRARDLRLGPCCSLRPVALERPPSDRAAAALRPEGTAGRPPRPGTLAARGSGGHRGRGMPFPGASALRTSSLVPPPPPFPPL